MTVPEEMAAELANKKTEREALRGVIQQWNANRLDLFELSEPNEDLEFHGVMRFYFQDSGQKVATKCIRVASDATSQAVIETLIEKFRPDMRMLSVPEYALYEIHENGEERKLGLEEKPLLVQLNWHIDDREGRFLLRRIDDKTNAQGVGFSTTEGSSFRRKLSKREKKQMKKQEKLSRLKSLEQDENAAPVDQNGVAEKLYTELPETSFTRSISNPEAVMRRRRQQKLERKLQQFRSKDGGPDTGGTLKIYGEALCKDVPYKTLLLSVRDSAAQVVREMLSKYGLDKVDPQQYCLVQVNTENINGSTHQEYILDDDECPLAILMNHPSTRGSIMFHVRRRPADYVPRKRKKKPAGKWNEFDHRYEDERLPFLLELNPDGTDIPNGAGARHRLQPNVTEVGSERPVGPQAVQAQTLTLSGPTVMPRHCVIAFTENIVTLTPCSRDAHTYVNNQRIHQTTILQNGAIVKFGRMHTFRFIDPAPEDRIRQRHDSNRQIDYAYDRRSPDATSQEVPSEKYRSGSGTPNGGQAQGQGQGHSSVPPSPTKSAAACSPRSPTHGGGGGSGGGSHGPGEATHNYETTFDLDGNVETASLTSSRDGNRLSHYERQQPRGTDPILPAVLEFLEETEEAFLHAVITDVEPSAPQFKLAPTYTLYLAARYRASTHYRPELQPTERAHRLTVMLANVATMIQGVIQERYMDASSLALWLANGSELLHMLKSDRHVGAFSTRAQDILANAVHTAFASLVRCVSLELAPAMSQFMADADEPAKEAGVLQIFSSTMALLRRCRVNAALTIQLFSHLFHAINATAFNALVSNGNLCVRWFGRRLKARLNALETWAERQGLELASQCHLATIMQATHLLQAPKYNAEELATLSSTCFKLNSLQVRALLQKYQPAADEPRLPAELIENVVKVAESVADTLARADGREIRLEEEPTLALALLLPEDGYSCEVIRGVPPGLAEFLAPLQRDGLCRMAPQPTSSGYWTIYMIDHHNNLRSPSAMSNRSGGYSGHVGPNQGQPEIHIIKLHKSTNGMGLSIVAAKGAGQDRLGIYIKSVVAGGAADADGRLTAGDQLLKVDGQSLVGITQEKAAEYLVRTGPIVTLEVAKQGAIYHGLATLLSQPSPVMSRAHKARPKSEHLEPPMRIPDAASQPSTSHSMGNLLSVPKQATSSYQERSVDWDAVDPSVVQPGAIATHLSESQFHFNQLTHEPPNQPRYPHAQSPRHVLDLSPEGGTYPLTTAPPRQWNNPLVCSPMYPIEEVGMTMEDGLSRSRGAYWPGQSIGQVEPARTYLTIPCHLTDHAYPTPYAIRNDHSSAQVPVVAHYGCCGSNRTEIIVSSVDDDELQGTEIDNPVSYGPRETASSRFVSSKPMCLNGEPLDSIPYIDETGLESSDKPMQDERNTLSRNLSEARDKGHSCNYRVLERSINEKTGARCSVHNVEDNRRYLNCPPVNIRRECQASSTLAQPPIRFKEPAIVVEPCIEQSDCITDQVEFAEAPAPFNDTSSEDNRQKEIPDLVTEASSALDELEKQESDDSESVDDTNIQDVSMNEEAGTSISTPKMHTIMPELNLDLSGLNSDVSSEDSCPEKCWKSPEEVRLGCGRVAALAKHFSRLGDAGLIKFKSMKLAGSRQFVSEPDIASPRSLELREQRMGPHTKDFKSESDLLTANQNEATTPERQWSVILLDIQANNDQNCGIHRGDFCRVVGKDDDGHSFRREKEQGEDVTKLSLAEQREIIKQLREFSNLDNADAPLFIPERGESIARTVTSNVRRYSNTDSPGWDIKDAFDDWVPMLVSSATDLSTLKGDQRPFQFVKYSSLRELSATEQGYDSQTIEDLSANKHSLVPVRTRIVSASEVPREKSGMVQVRLVKSCPHIEVSISRFDSGPDVTTDRDGPMEGTNTKNPSSVPRPTRCYRSLDNIQESKKYRVTNEEATRRKFPGAFIRTRKLSKSHGDVCSAKITVNEETKPLKKMESIESSTKRAKSLDSDLPRKSIASVDVRSSTSNIKSSLDKNQKAKCGKITTRPTTIVKRRPLIIARKSKSESDVSQRRPTPRFEKGSWTFHEFPSLECDSISRPRRMSERDLPSRLGHDTTPQQIHSSKSVPALHNVGTEGKQQHEVFNPGYSRASSSNSVTPPVQPPPMPAINGATSLRSRSSHNLHDPMRIGTLPPTGLVSRQQSSPNLNPNQPQVGSLQNNLQSNEAERFYQNLSVYRNQDPTMKQQPSPSQHLDDRSSLHIQKSLRGSQSSLNRPSSHEITQARDRPISAYIAQTQQQGYGNNQLQHQGPPPPRSQSSRDIIRQEAKLQEMQEEVRRRELRGGPSMLNQFRPSAYNIRSAVTTHPTGAASVVRPPRPQVSTPNLGPTSPTSYSGRQMPINYNQDVQYAQYGQYGQYNQYGKPQTACGQYGVLPKGKNEPIRGHVMPMDTGRDIGVQDGGRPYMDHARHFGAPQNGPHYSNGSSDLRNGQYTNENTATRTQQNGIEANVLATSEIPSVRPTLADDGYRESPPPPPPNTSTHPLYNKQTDMRYTASMQDPPRGSYYPTGVTGSTQQPRQYQYSATNPWQREEREKEQARRREAARQWRDQQIAELSTLPHRTPQQEEQLRALQLERDFQKRAEEAANQQDDDEESNDLDNESAQRVQGLLRMAATQERIANVNQQQTLSRTNASNQSLRGNLPPQPISNQSQPTNMNLHGMTNQQGSQNIGNICSPQVDTSPLQLQQNQQPQVSQSTVSSNQVPMSPTYGTSPGHFATNQKSYQTALPQSNEERDAQRRLDEVKRKQAEYDDNQRKREEEIRQQQQQQFQMQQMYQQQQHLRNQQALHPGMLRLDNLVINGPSTPPSLQNCNNEAPPPPERGSSYAIMSQQSALRSNNSSISNMSLSSQQSTTVKRVSFHDPNANIESTTRTVTTSNSIIPSSMSMDTIREDPNNFINDAENLLASPKTPEGPGGPFANATPGVIGAQEVYKDPRQKRLAEKQKQQNSQMGAVPEKLSFKEKMKMFAMETGEDGTPRDKVKISRAQREIDNIGGPLSPNNNNRS